jgi:hypothetical protein
MKTRTLSAYKQKGFSLLTGFILVIILFGSLAFFLAGSGLNSGFGSSYASISKASSLLTSAGYVNAGFTGVTLNGTAASAVTFDTTATTGMFNPTTGAATQPSLDPTLFADTSATTGYWIYAKNGIKLNNVGIDTNADYTILASGLKKGVCQQINNTLHGTALNVDPTTFAVNTVALLAASATAASPLASVAVDLSAGGTDPSTSGWSNGCYGTFDTPTVYVYIHTVLAQ